LAMNIDVMFDSLRHLLCRISSVAVTVFHRSLLIRYVFV
jgi:hypothetical protein